MALLTTNDYVAGLSDTQKILHVSKSSITTTAYKMYSLWKTGTVPAVGITPTTTAAVCDNTVLGSFSFTNAASGNNRLIIFIPFGVGSGSTQRNPNICDRLAHVGGYDGNTTSLQSFPISVTSLSAVRLGAADYSDVEWYLEWYTATGSSGASVTVTYTNGAGTGSRTTSVTLPASVIASRMIKIIGSGNESIQSIQSLQLNIATGTTGNFGITALRYISSGATLAVRVPGISDALFSKIGDGACLFFTVRPASTLSLAFDSIIGVMER